MEPFSILCQSCAARLKVTKASAVGQMLACPKCGTMIQVSPPSGWVAPESSTEISASEMSSDEVENRTGNAGADFDDIDHILFKPQPPTQHARQKSKGQPSKLAPLPSEIPLPQQRRVQSSRGPRRVAGGNDRRIHQSAPVKQAPVKQAPVVDGPVLPNEQWTSDATRRRKRIVTATIGVLGTLLLLGAVGMAIVHNFTKPKTLPVELANVDSSNGNEPELLDNGLLEDVELADAVPIANENNDSTSNTRIDVGAAPPVVDGPPPTDANPAAIGQNPSIPVEAVENTQIDDSAAQDGSASDVDESSIDDPGETGAAAQVTVEPSELEIKSPFAETKRDPDSALTLEPTAKSNRPAEVGMVEALESDLGDLSVLLEASGTSLMEIKDLTAAIRTRQIVGIPKYIIPFPDSARLDLEKQLEMPIGGLMYDNAPLTRIIQNLSAITGVPITVEARSIVAAGKIPNPEVSVKISDTTLDEALTELLTPLGLSHVTNPGGVTIGVFPSQLMSSKTFEIPGGTDIDDDGKKRLIAAIQILIEPESWARTDDPAKINLQGNQIVADCAAAAQAQIQLLLSKLDSSLALARSRDDLAALANTRSRWKSIKPSLTKDPALVHSVQAEIGTFLNQLQSKTGVSILVDWQHVVGEGWTPQTIVPGNVREPTVEATVDELARAMDLTYLAIDDSTLMMTTFAQTTRLVDLEVYPLGNLVPARLAPQQLIQLVTESLGAQLQSESVRYIFEPSFQCLIVSAPQQIQRQIEALIDRLENDLITPDRRPDQTQQATTR